MVTAVAPVVIACRGIWIGWTGLDDFHEHLDTIPESDPTDKTPTAGLLSKQVILLQILSHYKMKQSLFDSKFVLNVSHLNLSSKQAVPVPIDTRLIELYYNGCCNETFWPLFHSMPDRAIFNTDYWKVRN